MKGTCDCSRIFSWHCAAKCQGTVPTHRYRVFSDLLAPPHDHACSHDSMSDADTLAKRDVYVQSRKSRETRVYGSRTRPEQGLLAISTSIRLQGQGVDQDQGQSARTGSMQVRVNTSSETQENPPPHACRHPCRRPTFRRPRWPREYAPVAAGS